MSLDDDKTLSPGHCDYDDDEEDFPDDGKRPTWPVSRVIKATREDVTMPSCPAVSLGCPTMAMPVAPKRSTPRILPEGMSGPPRQCSDVVEEDDLTAICIPETS